MFLHVLVDDLAERGDRPRLAFEPDGQVDRLAAFLRGAHARRATARSRRAEAERGAAPRARAGSAYVRRSLGH